MILKALCDFYDRMSALGNGVSDGFERKNIRFVILIKKDGSFVELIDTRDNPADKKDKGRIFIVPRAEARTSGIAANLIWDTAEYVLGLPKGEEAKNKIAAKKKFSVFCELCNEIADVFPNNTEFAAVCSFLNTSSEIEAVLSSPTFEECKKLAGANFSFRIVGSENLVCENPDVSEFLKRRNKCESGEKESLCIVSGMQGVIARIHKGLTIGAVSGIKLVSFQENKGYDSYGKKKGLNAPISTESEFKYTTALGMLLAPNSGHKARLEDTAILFWGEKPSEFENGISSFFGFESTDDMEARSAEIKNLYKSVYTGMNSGATGGRFFVLGVEANKSRMVVRFWHSDKLENIAKNIRTYFDDLDIIKGKYDSELFSIFNILTQLSLGYKISNLPPRLSGDILKSAFTCALFPRSLQLQCINRIRADRKVGRIRSALLKAILNRKNRIYKSNEREIKMALDRENTNIGYLCGRLFAALEKIQKDALGDTNSTIVDRYYGAASTTPVSVFARLIDLSNHHLGKIENEGLVVVRKKLLQDIFDKFSSNGFPAHLSLDDQSRFAIGYYQQTQDFYKINDNKNEGK